MNADANTPVMPVTDASARESFMYAQLAVRGVRTDSIGTALTVELSKAWDAYLDEVKAEARAALSTPPANDVREALDHLDALNESGRIQYADYVALHDMVSRIEVRPRGTVTDAEVLRAKAAALTEFADAVRMPFTVFRGDNEEPITPGDLMRETAARYLAEAARDASS